MNEQTCCFTGHRLISGNKYHEIEKRLEAEIIRLIRKGVRYFGSGGAIGFDTMAALAVLKLKEQFPGIRLILVLPCKNQTKNWSEKDKDVYDYILKKADKTVYISEFYHAGCMQKRNRHLVNYSGFCICYLTENSGGTAYTVGYAKRRGLRIINIAES